MCLEVSDYLEQSGLIDNTMVVFMSDNGTVAASQNNRLVRNFLLGNKGHIYEGGIRVPLMIRWDGVIPPDTKSGNIVSVVDFFSSFTDLAGGTLSEEKEAVHDGHKIVLDNPQYCNNNRTLLTGAKLRWGDYALIYDHHSDKEENINKIRVYQLFNLTDNVNESIENNIADQHPGIVYVMAQKLKQEIIDTDSEPLKISIDEMIPPLDPGEKIKEAALKKIRAFEGCNKPSKVTRMIDKIKQTPRSNRNPPDEQRKP